jgi:hypothetical protein
MGVRFEGVRCRVVGWASSCRRITEVPETTSAGEQHPPSLRVEGAMRPKRTTRSEGWLRSGGNEDARRASRFLVSRGVRVEIGGYGVGSQDALILQQ